MFTLLVCALLFSTVYYTNSQTIEYNPAGYADYYCPYRYERLDLDYNNRRHWTFGSFGSNDVEHCALRDTRALCAKPSGASKWWMTLTFGHAEFHIQKFDQFSFGSSFPDSTLVTGYSSTSSSLIPWYFKVRAMYFYVRGVQELEILFEGETIRTIRITSAELDPRLSTFVCITWPESPTFWGIWFTFSFPPMRKAKFWGLYMVSCCEILTDAVIVGK